MASARTSSALVAHFGSRKLAHSRLRGGKVPGVRPALCLSLTPPPTRAVAAALHLGPWWARSCFLHASVAPEHLGRAALASLLAAGAGSSPLGSQWHPQHHLPLSLATVTAYRCMSSAWTSSALAGCLGSRKLADSHLHGGKPHRQGLHLAFLLPPSPSRPPPTGAMAATQRRVQGWAGSCLLRASLEPEHAETAAPVSLFTAGAWTNTKHCLCGLLLPRLSLC